MRYRRFAFAACVGAVVSVVVAIFFMVDAREERRSVAAAADLRLAALTVASADELSLAGGRPVGATLAASVDKLTEPNELALHSLPESDRVIVRDLVEEIASCGIALLDPQAGDHQPHNHDQLQELLAFGAERAAADAGIAERNAAVAVAVAAVALAFAGWLLARAHYRSAADRAVAVTQTRAGKRLEALLNDSPDMLLVIDPDGRIAWRSGSADRILNADARCCDDIVKLVDTDDRPALRDLLVSRGRQAQQPNFELNDRAGRDGWYEFRVSDLRDDELIGGKLITVREVTREVQLRSQLELQALTDPLTGLGNRRALPGALARAASMIETAGGLAAFVSVDLDGFKSINDTAGHSAGDQLLSLVADRLRHIAGKHETVLRLGGDEFAIVFTGLRDTADARSRADRLLDIVDEPLAIGTRLEQPRTSIGVAVTSRPEGVDGLVGQADIAMYEAKRRGGDTVVVYEPDMESATTRANQITRALRTADYDTEFNLVYQPIVTSATGKIVSIEALLRWTSDALGPVTPDEFIPIAESSGDICTIGRWVIEAACRQRAAWHSAGVDPEITISVNISARQLAEETLVPCILETIDRWGLRAAQFVVEVTETAVLDQAGHAHERLEQLREAGIKISIDDFGSGYSNLGQLLHVPFDIIKIDRSLLLMLTEMREQAGGDASDPCAIMEAIVAIAGVLGAPVVCEGVETPQQRASLQASGITHLQGYFTGKPAPAAALTPQLTQEPTRPLRPVELAALN